MIRLVKQLGFSVSLLQQSLIQKGETFSVFSGYVSPKISGH